MTMAATTATTTAARSRTIIGLSIGTAFVNGSATRGRLHQAKDQRLHLELTAHPPAQADFHLTLHTHPVDFRCIATRIAGELFPPVFEDPLDLTLCPERHLAGVGGGHHAA